MKMIFADAHNRKKETFTLVQNGFVDQLNDCRCHWFHGVQIVRNYYGSTRTNGKKLAVYGM